MTSKPLFRGFSQLNFPIKFSWGILDTWPNQYICASQFGGEVVAHSGLCEFHICTLCREVSHHGLFAKIPPLPLASDISGVGGGGGCMECKHTPKTFDLVKIPENLGKSRGNLSKIWANSLKIRAKPEPNVLGFETNGVQHHTKTFFSPKIFWASLGKLGKKSFAPQKFACS